MNDTTTAKRGYCADIEEATIANNDFRRVLYTGEHLQLVLMSLAPATAALAGFVFLGQHLAWLEIVGIALVIAASIGAVQSSARAAREAAEPLA